MDTQLTAFLDYFTVLKVLDSLLVGFFLSCLFLFFNAGVLCSNIRYNPGTDSLLQHNYTGILKLPTPLDLSIVQEESEGISRTPPLSY